MVLQIANVDTSVNLKDGSEFQLAASYACVSRFPNNDIFSANHILALVGVMSYYKGLAHSVVSSRPLSGPCPLVFRRNKILLLSLHCVIGTD